MEQIEKVLEQRGAVYGTFKTHAEVSQRMKRLLYTEAHTRGLQLDDDQKECLDMICHKVARIINGDPNYADSWRDIGGYAMLVAKRLEGELL